MGAAGFAARPPNPPNDTAFDIAVENHGDFTAAQLKALLDAVGHPRVGACLDTGNSLSARRIRSTCAGILRRMCDPCT